MDGDAKFFGHDDQIVRLHRVVGEQRAGKIIGCLMSLNGGFLPDQCSADFKFFLVGGFCARNGVHAVIAENGFNLAVEIGRADFLFCGGQMV